MNILLLVLLLPSFIFATVDAPESTLGKFNNEIINGKPLTTEELNTLEQIATETAGTAHEQLCERLKGENKALAYAQLEDFEQQLANGHHLLPAQQEMVNCICQNPDPEIQHLCNSLEHTRHTINVTIKDREVKNPAVTVQESTQEEPDPLNNHDAFRKYMLSLPQWKPLPQDQQFYTDDPIPGQVNALNKDGLPIYPADIDYIKKINNEIFKKNPEIERNYRKLIATNACPGCNLRGVQFKGRWFYKHDPKTDQYIPTDLRGADLTNANFDSARLAGADFRGATCKNATFNYAALSGANFRGANFSRSKPMNLKIKYNANKQNRFDRTAFSYTTAVRTIFDDCDFTNVDFSLALLAGSSFKRAQMQGAAFLFFTDLSNCTFEGAKNFIEDRWKEPEIYLSTSATVDSRRSPIKEQKPGTTKEQVTGQDYIVCDRLVKFYNTTFPDGRKFPEGYHITPGLGTSDVFRKIPTVQTK